MTRRAFFDRFGKVTAGIGAGLFVPRWALSQQGYLPNRRKRFPPAGSGGGGGAKSFAFVGVGHHYVASQSSSAVTYTPTAGNFLVACASMQNLVGSVSISDTKSNTWTLQQNTNSTGSFGGLLFVWTSPLVAGGSTVFTATGVNDISITILEYSGVSAVDQSTTASGATTMTSTLTTTDTDMFLSLWATEHANGFSSTTLTPGSISGVNRQKDNGHEDGQWDYLNSGAGFASGTYTNTVVSANNWDMTVFMALK